MNLSMLRVSGWRGGDLLTLGLVYLGIAASIILAPEQIADLVHTHLPIPFRVAVWGIPGLMAVVFGWVRSDRLQNLAFGLLCAGPAERSVSFFAAALGYQGYNMERLPGGIVYAGFLLFVLRLAARPEPVEASALPAALQPTDPEREA